MLAHILALRLTTMFLMTLALHPTLQAESMGSHVKDDPDAIVGVWKNGEGTGYIQITRNGNKYQGKIVWLKEPIDPETGKPKLDKKHPEESARTRPIMGMTNMWGFSYDKEGVWEGGKIYDPKKGSTYSCTIRIKDPNTLEVRGYIGISIIGRTDVWTRQPSK